MMIDKTTTRAIYLSWNIISGAMIIFLFILFFVDSSRLLSASPMCPSKMKGITCSFCGMTRAFLQIKEFDFAGALYFNSGSVVLFAVIFINSIIFSLHQIIKIK